MLKVLLSDLRAITNGFCDLVLGPLHSQEAQSNHAFMEIYADSPDLLEAYVEQKVLSDALRSVALLGFEPGRFQQAKKRAGSLFVMPADSALQLLYAAGELLLSDAIDVIVIYEILLKSDAEEDVLHELQKLRVLLKGSKSQLILVNPNTAERRRLAGELEVLCSRQVQLTRN